MANIERIPGNARMSNAVIHGGTVFLKGVTPNDPSKGIEDQTRDVLDQINNLLKQAGSAKEKTIKVTIWLSDIANFDAMNAIYDRWLVPGAQPVRACVEAKLAKPELLVEIQVTSAL